MTPPNGTAVAPVGPVEVEERWVMTLKRFARSRTRSSGWASWSRCCWPPLRPVAPPFDLLGEHQPAPEGPG
jgi:hypothetical protein